MTSGPRQARHPRGARCWPGHTGIRHHPGTAVSTGRGETWRLLVQKTSTEMTNHALFGIFMLNPYHNIVHLVIGSLWLIAAFAFTPAGTEGLNIAIGGVYALATVLGFLGYLSLLSIPSGAAGDNWLHLVSALAPLVFGSGLLRAMGGRQAATA